MKEGTLDTRQLIGIIACCVLFVGVFAPLVSLPFMEGDGTIVLVLAVLSLIVVLIRKYRWLWFTGVASLGMLTFTFVSFQHRMSSMRTDMSSDLADNPFAGLADLAVDAVQMQWGWGVLLAGGAMLLITAGMKEREGGTEASGPLRPPPAPGE
jgi:cell division protein FtsW (lipid II flippase)